MGCMSLSQKGFLAFLLVMGIVVALSDAYCFSEFYKPWYSKKGKARNVFSLDCSMLFWLYVDLPGRAQNKREGGDVRKTQIEDSCIKLP